MHDNTFTDEHKEKLGNEISKVLFEEVEKNTLSMEDTRPIAQHILNRLDEVHTQGDIVAVLYELQVEYPWLQSVYADYKGLEHKKSDDQAIEDLHNYINTLKQ
jgi:hypothetical protein